MHPLSQNQHWQAPQEMRGEIGYKISQSHDQEKAALHAAFDLVQKARKSGSEMRAWAQRSEMESQLLMDKLKRLKSGPIEARVWELTCLENKILMTLRNYMNETSEFLNKLKPLNPPLRSEQIKPFLEAILSDRRVTIGAMETLTKMVGEITAFKLDINNNPPRPLFDYVPPA